MKTFAHDRSEVRTHRRVLRAELRGGERAVGKRVIADALHEQMVAAHEEYIDMTNAEDDDIYADFMNEPLDEEEEEYPMEDDYFDDYEPDDYGFEFSYTP